MMKVDDDDDDDNNDDCILYDGDTIMMIMIQCR